MAPTGPEPNTTELHDFLENHVKQALVWFLKAIKDEARDFDLPPEIIQGINIVIPEDRDGILVAIESAGLGGPCRRCGRVGTDQQTFEHEVVTPGRYFGAPEYCYPDSVAGIHVFDGCDGCEHENGWDESE